MQKAEEKRVQSLDLEDPLEEEMATQEEVGEGPLVFLT